jgi:GTP:adenosylcobinamide-phosphate guanylyltransferase
LTDHCDHSLFTAIVLAGSRGAQDPVALHAGVSHKALAKIAGRPMLERVVAALDGAASVGHIIIVIEDPDIALALPAVRTLAEERRLDVIAGAQTPSLSVKRVLEAYGEHLPFLIATADHPLLTPAMVDEFCQAAAGNDDIVVGAMAERRFRAAYPDNRRTFLRFRDEAYSGCNLFALLTRKAFSIVDFWSHVEARRKTPWRLVRAFGWRNLIAFLLRRLTMRQGAARASAVLGLRLSVVEMTAPEAAIDVDRPEDMALAEKILSHKMRVPPS